MSKKDKTGGALAYGPVRRWSRAQPKLLATTPGEIPDIDPKETLKRVTLGLRFFITSIIVILISGIGALLLLGTTVLPVIPVDGQTWLVQRAVYVQGQVPKQAVVLSLGKPIERTVSSRFTLLFQNNPQASIIEIIASPLDKVNVNKQNIVIVNGQSTGLLPSEPMSPHTLGDQYLGVCLQGACGKVNTILEIPTNYVLGKVLGNVRFGLGLGSPPVYSGGLND